MSRFPFGDRVLFASPPLSSLPGHVPTHDAGALYVGNVAAGAPTSAIICIAESTPNPGTSATRSTASRFPSAVPPSPGPVPRSALPSTSTPPALSSAAAGTLPAFPRTPPARLSIVPDSPVSGDPLSAAITAGFVSPSASAFSIRRPLSPSRSDTKLDNSMCVSSNKASSWF